MVDWLTGEILGSTDRVVPDDTERAEAAFDFEAMLQYAAQQSAVQMYVPAAPMAQEGIPAAPMAQEGIPAAHVDPSPVVPLGDQIIQTTCPINVQLCTRFAQLQAFRYLTYGNISWAQFLYLQVLRSSDGEVTDR